MGVSKAEVPMTLRSEYEAGVLALRGLRDQMRREGHDEETIARALHAERRAIAARFKLLTPEPMRSRVEARTLEVYGDRAGPTIDWLRAHGKTWGEIIESAMKPGKPPLPTDIPLDHPVQGHAVEEARDLGAGRQAQRIQRDDVSERR